MSGPLQTVAVFGATGFIGRHLIQHLTRKGFLVRAVTRVPNKATFLKPAGGIGQVTPWAGDVGDDASVRRALAGVDMVVNLIGVLYERGAAGFQALHVDAPARLARLATEAGVKRFVHVSALGADAGSPAAYARSKAEGEAAVKAGFPGAAILRPSIVFGPEDGFFNKFAAMAQLAPALPLIGGGQTKFQPVYVADVAEAITAAVTSDAAAGKTFELGGPAVYTFKQLLEILLKEIEKPGVCLVPVPWKAAEFLGDVLGKTPVIAPPLTRDQVEMLKTDNVLSGSLPGLQDLGVAEPSSVEVVVPTYLHRFIEGGLYARLRSGKKAA
jgi:uncharacterized protein YbjT (DUF2867 family)